MTNQCSSSTLGDFYLGHFGSHPTVTVLSDEYRDALEDMAASAEPEIAAAERALSDIGRRYGLAFEVTIRPADDDPPGMIVEKISDADLREALWAVKSSRLRADVEDEA
jgi:hypothetical protein